MTFWHGLVKEQKGRLDKAWREMTAALEMRLGDQTHPGTAKMTEMTLRAVEVFVSNYRKAVEQTKGDPRLAPLEIPDTAPVQDLPQVAMTKFMCRHAKQSFMTINELWHKAKQDKFAKTKDEFESRVTHWMRCYPHGDLPNGLAYYCELPFKKSQGSIRHPLSGHKIGMLKIGHRMNGG
jgi:hypothetical protein